MAQNRERIDFNNPGTWPVNWMPDPNFQTEETFGLFKSIGDPKTGVIRSFRVLGQVIEANKPDGKTQQFIATRPYLCIDITPRGLYRETRFRKFPHEIEAVTII